MLILVYISSASASDNLYWYAARRRTSAQSPRCLGPLLVGIRVETSLEIAQSNLRPRSMLPDRYIEHVFLHETMAHVSRCLPNTKLYTFTNTLRIYPT